MIQTSGMSRKILRPNKGGSNHAQDPFSTATFDDHRCVAGSCERKTNTAKNRSEKANTSKTTSRKATGATD